jgi:LysM repeat protein
MNPLVTRLVAVLFAAAFCHSAMAQTLASGSPGAGDRAAIETLIKKIDEQNMKIDALSQQILKLEQQISAIRPGVMIGESTPAPTTPTTTTSSVAATAATPPSGNEHVVAKGETLISIAKAHKVGVDELQKHNHIEDARKLQAGQTIIIPTPGASPAASASPAPNQ